MNAATTKARTTIFAVILIPLYPHQTGGGIRGCSVATQTSPQGGFLDAIASPSSYPCQSVGQSVSNPIWGGGLETLVASGAMLAL